MDLLSVNFLILLAITFIFYYVLPKKVQWICLLTASFIFYYFTGKFNFIFILLSSASTFFLAKALSKLNNSFTQKKNEGTFSKDELKEFKLKIRSKKRLILVLTLIINFGILGFLKYWNTIADSLSLDFLVLNHGKGLLLPLGISFYTFQAISYFMDVYNGKIKDEKNFFKYLLFISYFPQLIQGPINRYDKLGTELSEEHNFNFENIKEGLFQFIFGALKKYAIADCLYNFISAIFDGPYNNLPGSIIVFGILLYSAYQYADFSGGIDMVIGISKLFGIKMQPNFKQPYFSISLADFWRRWHISLGLWMKDYVFYPFVLTEGMQNLTKKCGKFGKHLQRTIPAGIANILVFSIVGIWHGPEMHYVLWGLYNGLVIALSDFLKPVFTKWTTTLHINTKSFGHKLWQIIRTFVIVNIGWYFDRIYDVKKSFVFLKNTFLNFDLKHFNICKNLLFEGQANITANLGIACLSLLLIFFTSLVAEKHGSFYEWLKERNVAIRWGIIYIFILILIMSFSNPNAANVFMYANY